jgi:hypothetical protein
MGYKVDDSIKCVICGSAPIIARLLCRPCYTIERRKNNLANHAFITPEKAFHLKYVISENGCWDWIASKRKDGYGIFNLANDKKVRAHRYSYELHNGKINDALKVVMHSCDNPKCVNPAHLSLGTRGDNLLDAYAKHRRTTGDESHLSKISELQALAILSDTRPQSLIAKEYGLHQSQISRIKSGKRRARSIT